MNKQVKTADDLRELGWTDWGHLIEVETGEILDTYIK